MTTRDAEETGCRWRGNVRNMMRGRACVGTVRLLRGRLREEALACSERLPKRRFVPYRSSLHGSEWLLLTHPVSNVATPTVRSGTAVRSHPAPTGSHDTYTSMPHTPVPPRGATTRRSSLAPPRSRVSWREKTRRRQSESREMGRSTLGCASGGSRASENHSYFPLLRFVRDR